MPSVRAAASGGPVSWSFLGFSVAPRRLVPPAVPSAGVRVGPLSPPRVAPSVGRRRPKAAERAPICPPSARRTPPERPPSCPRAAPVLPPSCPRAARRSPNALGQTPRAHRAASRPAPLALRSGGKSDRNAASIRSASDVRPDPIVCPKMLKTTPHSTLSNPCPIWFPPEKFVTLPTVEKVSTRVT